VDLRGKAPLVEPSAEWLRAPTTERHRTVERRRRRRTRKRNDIRAQIRVRMWIAVTVSLALMAVFLYMALARQPPAESGQLVASRTSLG
jgi:hypothetical protein